MSQKSKKALSSRKQWQQPELIRLNAGLAENFNATMVDGGLVPGTDLS